MWVNDKWGRVGNSIYVAAVGPSGPDERCVTDQRVVFDRKVLGRGDRDRVRESATEFVPFYYTRMADIVAELAAKPSAGANSDTDSGTRVSPFYSTIKKEALLDDGVFKIAPFSVTRIFLVSRKPTQNCIVCDNSSRIVTAEGEVVNHVDTSEEGMLNIGRD